MMGPEIPNNRIKVNNEEKRTGVVGLTVVLLLLLFLPSITYGLSINLEYRLGFNGLFALNKWSPITISIENRGKAIKGFLEVLTTSGSEYRRDVYNRTYSKKVEIPTNSKKQYQMTVYIESFTHPLVIRLKDAMDILETRNINLRTHYRTQELLVFIDSQLRFYQDPRFDNQASPTLSRGRFLPETWYGYDGVRMLVIPARAWQDINEKQLAAMEEWVSRGGCLIAMGGINYSALTNQKLSRILPLSISGIREVRGLGSLDAFTGIKLPANDSIFLLEAKLKGARVKVKEKGIPIISQRIFGKGNVFFLAFDYEGSAFREWKGHQQLWANLLSLAEDHSTSFFNPSDRAVYELMIKNLSLRFPFFPWAVLLLTLNIAPALFLIKRVETRKEKRWTYMGLIILWVIITSLSCFGYFFMKYSQHGPRYNQFSMLRLSGSKPVPLFKEFIGIYNLKSQPTQVRLGDNLYPVKDFMFERVRERAGDFFNLEERPQYQVIHIDLERWTHRFFSLKGKVDFSIKARVIEDEEGLLLEIDNQTPYKIDLCRLYYSKRFFDIQPIQAEGRVLQRIDTEKVTKQTPYHLIEKSYSDLPLGAKKPKNLSIQMAQDLNKDLLQSIHYRYDESKDMVYLTGWIAQAVKPIMVESSGSGNEAATLVEWVIPIEKQKTESRTDARLAKK